MGKMTAAYWVGIGRLAAILFTSAVHPDQVLVMAFNDTISKPWKRKDHGENIQARLWMSCRKLPIEAG
jgi:hypothetical protein